MILQEPADHQFGDQNFAVNFLAEFGYELRIFGEFVDEGFVSPASVGVLKSDNLGQQILLFFWVRCR